MVQLKETIYKRKSVRKYKSEPLNTAILNEIVAFCEKTTPLYPDIKVKMDIVEKKSVKSMLRWLPPHAIAFFSEEKSGYLENAGFILQQVDLYLQARGIGSCWLGMGKPDEGTLDAQGDFKYVIMLVFGMPNEEFRAGTNGFKRRPMEKISDTADERLEAARLAPSSVNSQPWYFTHEGETIHLYRNKQGMLRHILGDMNQIDVGIALAHVYAENPDSFRFFKADKVAPVKGCDYVGSFTI